MGYFFNDDGTARDPDQPLVLARKGLDDAMWSDFTVNEAGQISLKAAEAVARSVTPEQAYETIYVNKAVRAIASQLAKAKGRLFDRKTGEEIEDADVLRLLKKPAPKTTYRRLIHDIVSWLNLRGELAINIRHRRGEEMPSALLCLNPGKLAIHKPMQPSTREEIVQWRYDWFDGTTEYIRADHVIFDTLFNPNDPVRGLPPTVVGTLEIGGARAIAQYNKNFFDNNAIPSHIIDLGEGVGRQQREDWTRRYLAEYGTKRNNAFKAMVASGGEIKVHPIAQAQKDGAFMELRKSVRDDIAMLYHVPAAEMGIFGETKQDTINDERKMFVEATLTPQAEAISECLQYQLIDPFFAFRPVYSRKKAVFTKAMGERFDEARSSREDSPYIFMIDLDTLPIMAAVNAAKIDQAAKFKETLQLSAHAVAEYFDIDVNDGEDDKPLRKEIWGPNNVACYSNPSLSLAMQPKPADPASTSADKGKKKKADAKRADAKRGAGKTKRTKACERSFRDLRRLTMETLERGEMWSLAEADELCPGFDREVRIVRNRLSKAVTQDDARKVFNAIDYSQLTGTA